MKRIKYVGLDVHKEMIQIALIEEGRSDFEMEKSIPNEDKKITNFFRSLASENNTVIACYEAGCLGYGIYRLLTKMGIECKVVAPGKIPRMRSDRIKTDRRDARLLAKMLKANELTSIYVPTEEDESVRDYLRAREDVRIELMTQKQQLSKFLLRNGHKYSERQWTLTHWKWMSEIKWSHNALSLTLDDYRLRIRQSEDRVSSMDKTIEGIAVSPGYAEAVSKLRCFKGIDYLTALSLVCEVGDFRRFNSAKNFMAYLGLVPSEHSSGGSRRQGGITKSGNVHLRRLFIESSWHYTRKARYTGKRLTERRRGQAYEVIQTADNAIHRLNKKFLGMIMRSKNKNTAIVGVARELSGFVWGAMTTA